MARNEGLERIQRETESLKRIPLDVVITSIWPSATAKKEGVSTRWDLGSDGKVVTRPDSRGSDLYLFVSGPHAGKKDAGAINLLLDAGIFHGFQESRRYLMRLDPSRVQSAITERKQSISITRSPDQLQEFRLPMRTFDPQKNLRHLTDYLTTERKLPRALVESLARSPHPPFYAGFGTKYADYIIFPCRDHSLSQAVISVPSASLLKPTGAILRWRHPDRQPPANQFGGKKSPMAVGTRRDLGWWQIGQGHDTLIITEAPIDGLTVLAAMPDTPAINSVAIMATGGTGGLNPKQFQGFDRILLATDADREGDRIAEEAQSMAQPRQTVTRVRPQEGFKDWNVAWQADPESVKSIRAQAFKGIGRGVRKEPEHEESFER